MSPQSFAGPLEGLLTALQRIEILAPILVGIAIAAFLILRRRKGSSSSEVEFASLIEEEAAGEAEEESEKEKSGHEDEFSKIQARALEALKVKGTLRPSPMAASKEGGHYPDIVGASLADVEKLLKGFVEKGLAFEGEIEFSVISCPICGSCAQVALISCKNCGSLRVQEIRYYRHTCGFIGPESSFSSEEGLTCPQCKSSEGVELYHKKYYCPDCMTESDEVNIAFKCGSCGALYDEATMTLKPFRRIELSREALAEYEKISRAISAQIMKLREEGYTIERPASLTGESGVIHSFEAVAKKGDETIAIASSFGEPLTQTLFKLGVAKSDLKLNKIILVTAKPVSPAERDFARSLGVELVEGP